MISKIRHFVQTYNEELFFVLVVLLTGLIGFGIGRLSVTGEEGSGLGGLQVKSTPVSAQELIDAIQGRGEVVQEGSTEPTGIVGNKNSHIFHLSTCSGAKRMSESNKIYFASIEEAVRAGFRPAGNCPGL